MRGTRWYYIRAFIVTMLAIIGFFIWDAKIVTLGIFSYFIIQEIIYFIIDRRKNEENSMDS
ncbi:hypothetical protein QJV03_09175 [Listeria swaminathanii]|uniref:Uncharacterized protein n=1 Tax=Listeria swaminathanii TaxID=2713501 RepID=A0ABU2IHA3_9LIST|nr:hypothetical protein [Listeria swaminathanii]MDT0017350.1 hypothetical protein [Listeria swaminathanii]MDT0023304.1 hypothetical protein [Listeria swaminathanii]MDT0034246.1 hypothetical protein [Listeria swaminathanii]MDT0053069.1 hypothetical protein [Listeria swaminathanii]MDT0055834.1 hypothetical protein [Listeria swaminathanii]